MDVEPEERSGHYAIVDDSFKHMLDIEGDPLRVVGTKGKLSFTAQFEVRPSECRCHVQKVSGPESVTLE